MRDVLGDMAKGNNTCRLCFGHVCHSCKVVQKLSFVDPDMQLARRNVRFCPACISSVMNKNALEVARERIFDV